MDTQNPAYASTESLLSGLLRERTGYEIADLDRDATFMELGFDSLFLIQLSQEIKQRFSVKVAFRELIEEVSTIDKLVEHLVELQPAEAPIAASDASRSDIQPEPTALAAGTDQAYEASPAPPASAVGPAIQARSVAPPVPVTQQPVVAQSPVAPAPLPVAAPAPTAMPMASEAVMQQSSGLEQIILQQNALMAQHLAILHGQALPVAAPVAVQSNGVITSPVAAPAPLTPSDEPCDTACTGDVTAAPAPKPVNKHERFGPYKPIRRGVHGLTDQQQQHLSQFVQRFTTRTAKSRSHAESHRDHFADPRGVSSYRRIWKTMVYQIAVEKSKGSKLWDIDGNRYVDIAMGFGLNLFGQSPHFVTKALHEQLDRGVEVGPQSPIAGDVAQLLCDFARKDRATFCNTGSEAVMAAMRLARTVTGKSKVVYFNKDYHGNFDQVLVRSNRIGNRQVSMPAAPGVPQSYADNMIVLDYGTPEALQTIQERADEIAAVLIEPVQSADPFLQPKEFLHEIRRITRENDMAMIMDEVITGFRAAQGGAQEWFDVWADMATYGKILGGGMPIGALAGSSKYMDALDGGTWRYDDDSEPEADMTFFAGTFVRHPLGLVAAHQVLQKLKDEGPELQQNLTARTTAMVERLNAFFERELFPIRVAQFASQFRFMFPPDLEYADMLYFHMLDRGVFTRGWGDNCFLSTEHTDEDIEFVINAVQDSCLELRNGGFFPSVDSTSDSPIPIAAANINVEPKEVPATASPILDSSDKEEMSSRISTLVEIQPDGDGTPLFCMPAADGLTMVYHEMANHLSPNQVVYGLNSPGAYGLPLPDTLEEMASILVDEIRQVQPHGPYLLTGWCSGGTLAYEIAQQLTDAGERVAMLALIESYNWLTAPSTNPTKLQKFQYRTEWYLYHFFNFLKLSWKDKKTFLNSKRNARVFRSLTWRLSAASMMSKKATKKITSSVNLQELWRKHDVLCEAYVPRPYQGKLIQIRPKRDYTYHLGEEMTATGGVEFCRMRAYPGGMMVNPFVAELARQVQQFIDAGLLETTAISEQSNDDAHQHRPEINLAGA